MPQTRITFLGTGDVVPAPEDDTASYILNGTCLVDTGWYAALNMRRFGYDPMDLEWVFLTHCHHDHYMGLAGVLFYLRMRAHERPNRPPLKVAGPAADIRRVVDLARAYLQTERFPDCECMPEVIPVAPGSSLDTGVFQVQTAASIHPVPGLMYRFTDKNTGRVIAISGDTAYQAATAEIARGCDLLVHEYSFGARSVDPTLKCGHSGALDAARVAVEAGAHRLAIVHSRREHREESLAAARQIFPETLAPSSGDTLTL